MEKLIIFVIPAGLAFFLMRNLIIISAFTLLIGCKKDPKISVPTEPEQPVTLVPVVDSIKRPPIGLEIGNKAPEIALRDSSGNIISLSSFNGKIVLIDFWASWCAPCRIENGNLTASYPKFNDTTFKNASGYEIFSVSTDANRLMWVNQLNYAQYSWKYNVRDTSSAYAQLYKIIGIPSNFLIDEKGIIIAKNLRGTLVTDTLKSLLKK